MLQLEQRDAAVLGRGTSWVSTVLPGMLFPLEQEGATDFCGTVGNPIVAC